MLVFMVTKDDFDRYGIWKSKLDFLLKHLSLTCSILSTITLTVLCIIMYLIN